MEQAVTNNLLSLLRPADHALLRPHLEAVTLEVGTVLFQAGDEVRWAHFPCGGALVAFQVGLEDGHEVETALVGREGAVGGIVSQGRLPAFSCAVVRVGGGFLRIPSAELEAAKQRAPALAHVFARYADCLLAQVFQGVACNAAHTIGQRAARWLLAARDRTGLAEVELTQEELAGMLGVGRSYVSRVVNGLRARGVVATRRGRLEITDPAGLAALSCGCEQAVRRHFREVLDGVYPTAAESLALRSA
ncbi:Crp/Fnr family transcriptional regulator [Roseococcus sp. DSY-14]|uniref:Crp/Fnr family transcriptional regulator n=1 Tax=Roseococcus sp. DSY-14 TaxID=3369650 RepID=UPI00387B0A5A